MTEPIDLQRCNACMSKFDEQLTECPNCHRDDCLMHPFEEIAQRYDPALHVIVPRVATEVMLDVLQNTWNAEVMKALETGDETPYDYIAYSAYTACIEAAPPISIEGKTSKTRDITIQEIANFGKGI